MPPGRPVTSIFPLPLISVPSHSRQRRRNRSTSRRATLVVRCTQLANTIIYSLNILACSYASSFYSFPCVSVPLMATEGYSAATMRLIGHVYQRARSFTCYQSGGDSCDHFSTDYSDSSFINAGDFPYQRSTATPIVADQVSLPAVAGTVDLLAVLPPDVAAVYASDSCSGGAVSYERPPRFHGPKREYFRLIERLRDAGMIDFSVRPKVVNGLFGVPKGDKQIRLIIDARPANSVFPEPPSVRLPTPDLMARVRARPGHRFFVAKSDVSDFYHRLRLPRWMSEYFALPGVRAGDIGLSDRYGDDTIIYPTCLTLPMGWSHSVFVAQSAHEWLLSGIDGFDLSDAISGSDDFDPRLRPGRCLFGVYIDDLTIISESEAAVNSLQGRYVQHMDAIGLTTKVAKQIRASSDGVESVGLLVDGTRHTIGVAPDKLKRLCRDTAAVLRRGWCSGLDMSELVGRWTWAALVNRPVLSALSAVYRFVEVATSNWHGTNRLWRFDIWPSVRRELEVIMGLAPLMVADLSAPFFPLAIASDASLSGLGVSVADRSDSVAQDIETLRWRTVISAPWRRSAGECINQLEMRALDAGVRWVLSNPDAIGRRIVVWVDSTAVLGSVRKGRSSMPHLLRRLRGVAALVLAGGLVLDTGWVPSELNPADAASRRFDDEQ